MPVCPCCRSHLVRQVNRSGLHWFCLDCRQAMPVIEDPVLTELRYHNRSYRYSADLLG
ncbi:MAG: hypothetical protein F6K04_24400 [Leptolyngbya sp. SIO4C5]|nr:hypothetical protein [Leptolyngbya sp. SIO4C5]